jgi:hypothetical protein
VLVQVTLFLQPWLVVTHRAATSTSFIIFAAMMLLLFRRSSSATGFFNDCCYTGRANVEQQQSQRIARASHSSKALD